MNKFLLGPQFPISRCGEELGWGGFEAALWKMRTHTDSEKRKLFSRAQGSPHS